MVDYVRTDFNYQWGNQTGKAYVQAQCNLCGGVGAPTFPHEASAVPLARTSRAEAKARKSVDHTHACALLKAAGAG